MSENENTTVETPVATTLVRAKAKSVDDVTFIEVNERVRRSDNPCIEEVVKQLRALNPDAEPMKPDSVTARRSSLRKIYGQDVLPEFPRGGGGAKKNVAETLEKIKAMRAKLDEEFAESDGGEA